MREPEEKGRDKTGHLQEEMFVEAGGDVTATSRRAVAADDESMTHWSISDSPTNRTGASAQ